MTRTRVAVVAVLAGFGSLIIVVGAMVFQATFALDEAPCNDPGHPSPFVVMVILGCFVLGHHLGRFRRVTDRQHHPRGGHLLGARRWVNRQSALILHTSLAVFLLVGLLLLVYESFSLDNPWHLQPITAYVRCARTVSPTTSTLFASGVAFVLGHWLWYPRRKDN